MGQEAPRPAQEVSEMWDRPGGLSETGRTRSHCEPDAVRKRQARRPVLQSTGRGARRFAGEEAFPAINRPALGRFERYRGFAAALRTHGHGFGLGEARPRRTLPLGLATLTALGLILEILVVEEMLFSRCEYEIRSAICTLKDAVLKLRHSL